MQTVLLITYYITNNSEYEISTTACCLIFMISLSCLLLTSYEKNLIRSVQYSAHVQGIWQTILNPTL
jgi:hypothetical protein